MPIYDLGDGPFGPSTQYQSLSSRRSFSKGTNGNNRKSSVTQRKPLSIDNGEDDDPTSARSLAHELAVALMPEPTAGSKLLAEELGLEFDEGAEGIDEPSWMHQDQPKTTSNGNAMVLADEVSGGSDTKTSLDNDTLGNDESPPQLDPEFDIPSPTQDEKKEHKRPEQDMAESLARDLEVNARFIKTLQNLDTELTVEQIASNTIRRINETVRDREGQVRELLQYEREFRHLASEVGGSDALAHLEALEPISSESDLPDPKTPVQPNPNIPRQPHLETVEEESSFPVSDSQDWEIDPDRNHLGDEEPEIEGDSGNRAYRDNFPPPPPLKGPVTPAKTIPQLAHLRTVTSSFATSLATCSEQAQVNGAGLTEAARKIRSLKHKMIGMYAEWDSTERSKLRIERWEAGMADANDTNIDARASPAPTRPPTFKRVDGRKIVQEHLHAFERALADASLKTQAIMAR
ncbi:hypothetical protein AMATHDRAFT_2770 [Amanita thiersii Skay4041]|uniref:Uncharacterized protein n=1 Tax=Amanita thiersii Skay4041 TaxID=703135 RepID=A0A2A9NRC1_9AGAR|nr:hypothetical protein AMATHDRAFT_2770 [Amanita thiersii Skay4041]